MSDKLADSTQELAKLARARFGDLGAAELKLLASAVYGVAADCAESISPRPDPAKAADWSHDCTIRSTLVAWLCTDPSAGALIDYHGLQARSARLEGRLDLGGAEIKMRLALVDCAIPAGIDLRDSHLKTIELRGSHCGPIWADRLVAEGALLFRDRFRARGGVSLINANIRGDLACNGGTIINEGQVALNADRATIGGDVFLNAGFHAEGGVRFVNASVGGSLTCWGGCFHHPRSSVAPGPDGKRPRVVALHLDRASIKGNVFLNRGFEADGGVRMLGATIEGDLECQGGTIRKSEDFALNAAGVHITGSAFFERDPDTGGPFRTDGGVNLIRADIGKDLSFWGAEFFDAAPLPTREKTGLNARQVEVGGVFRWLEVKTAEYTRLSLVFAKVGPFEDDPASWPKAGDLLVDGFVYDSIRVPSAPKERRAWLDARLSWLERQPGDAFSMQPYDQLADALRRAGREAEARTILIAKEKARTRRSRPLERAWGRMLEYTIAYGYRSQLAFVWALVFILFGTVVFQSAGEQGYLVRAKKDGPARISYFMYSVDMFVPIIDFYQQGNWVPRGGTPLGEAYLWYFWFHIAAGWVFITLGVAGFTGLVRRE